MTAVADTGSDAVPNVGTGLPSVSARLKAAREALGLSLADVATRTRITSRHVQAVEDGDFGSLPGRPYAIGFARSYARAVGLDETEIARAVREELGTRTVGPEPRVINQFDVDDPAKTPSRLITWLALLLFGALVTAIVLFLPTTFIPSIGLPSLISEQPKPVPTVAAPPPPPAAVPAPAPTGPVVFTALTDKLWVKFYDGSGKQLLQKQLAQGESYTVPADAVEPKLWTGRADALAVTIGGQAVPKISDHEGVVKDVPVSAAALLARSAPKPAVAEGANTAGVAGPAAASQAVPQHVAKPFVRRRPRATAAPVASDPAAVAPAVSTPAVASSPAT